MYQQDRSVLRRQIRTIALAVGLLVSAPAFAGYLTSGNLIVSVEGNGSGTGTYTDNQAAPLTFVPVQPVGREAPRLSIR